MTVTYNTVKEVYGRNYGSERLSFIDLPVKVDEEITSYKFFLELSAIEPVTYTLLLTSEH